MKFIPYEYDLKNEYFEKLKDQRKAKKANKLRAFGTPKVNNKIWWVEILAFVVIVVGLFSR
tara:strand:+ start:163 stop:345 length:183 start_codon:yes stop_codon:yes gene_type:complete